MGILLILFVIILMLVSTILYSISILIDSFISLFSNIEIIIQSIIAFGTLLAVGVALFKDEIINHKNRIDLEVIYYEKSTFEHSNTMSITGPPKYKFFLYIKDKRGKLLVENAKVRLIRISQVIDDKLYIEPMPSETLFIWNKYELNLLENTFLSSAEINFGEYDNILGRGIFKPTYHTREDIDFKYVRKNENKIYEIDVISDNYISKKKYYINVYSDGSYFIKPDSIFKHVQINIVDSIEDFKEPIKYEDKKEVEKESSKEDENP